MTTNAHSREIAVSFEFFPLRGRRDGSDIVALSWVQRLALLAPHFVSVTYGADGLTRTRTHNIVTRIGRETRPRGHPT